MHHPWQVGPVSPLDRIVVTSLVALATDSVFLWRATPHEAISVLLFLTPAVIAIRIIRGFPTWRPVATGFLGAAGTIAVISASRANLSSHEPTLRSGRRRRRRPSCERRGLGRTPLDLATHDPSQTCRLASGPSSRRRALTLADRDHVPPDNGGHFVRKTHDFLRRLPLGD